MKKTLTLALLLGLISSSFAIEEGNTGWGNLPSELKQKTAEYSDENALKALMEVDKATNNVLQATKAERIIRYDVSLSDQKDGLIAYLERAKKEGLFVKINLKYNTTNQTLQELEPYLNCVKYLDLSFNNKLTDLSSLTKCIQLSEIYLYKTLIKEARSLENLTNLTILDLHNNTMFSDVGILKHHTRLRSLDLYGTNVTDVSSLTTLTNLRFINLPSLNVQGKDELIKSLLPLPENGMPPLIMSGTMERLL